MDDGDGSTSERTECHGPLYKKMVKMVNSVMCVLPQFEKIKKQNKI